ncbi:MAG: hypothetical protein ACREIW_12105, partial [Chthoniobacterales bacterium]
MKSASSSCVWTRSNVKSISHWPMKRNRNGEGKSGRCSRGASTFNANRSRMVFRDRKIVLPFCWPITLHSTGLVRKMDNIIEAKELQIERKHFYVEFRENDRGKFLRITEEAHGRRNTIIVP